MKFENTEVFNFGGALRGMRNPMNSWDKSDSYTDRNTGEFVLGEQDLSLAQKLIRGGSEHRKFMRQIFVSVDITAPLYWYHEFDTYHVGVTRNSCSLQHKGSSRRFTIRDFEMDDERVYDILDPIEIKKEHPIVYPYETEEYRVYQTGNRKYKIFKNGRIIVEAFERTTDRKSKGVATLHFPERELFPTQGSHGYYYCDLGGRYYNEKWTLHRLVAAVWLQKPHDGLEINHIDGNKGNNSVENLEWITHQENEIHKHATGLVDDNKLSTRYKKYKNLIKIPPYKRLEITNKHKSGVSQKTLAKEYGCSQSCISAIINEYTTSELSELFGICWMWEKTIEKLNHLRDLYVETNDYQYFRAMRALMPQGYLYKSTVTMSYENLYNMIHQRKDHKLNEWSGKDDPTKPNFVKWCASLPYAKEFLFLGIEQDYEHFQDIIST